MASPDWKQIETDFLATGLSYSKLAKKYGVSISTLKKKAAAGKWGQKAQEAMQLAGMPERPRRNRNRNQEEPVPAEEPVGLASYSPVEIAANFRRERREYYMQLTDGMAQRIDEALQKVNPSDVYSIALLTRALKDLRDIQGLRKDELDVEEQLARIDKLRSETRVADDGEEYGVIVMPEYEILTPPEDNDA